MNFNYRLSVRVAPRYKMMGDGLKYQLKSLIDSECKNEFAKTFAEMGQALDFVLGVGQSNDFQTTAFGNLDKKNCCLNHTGQKARSLMDVEQSSNAMDKNFTDNGHGTNILRPIGNHDNVGSQTDNQQTRNIQFDTTSQIQSSSLLVFQPSSLLVFQPPIGLANRVLQPIRLATVELSPCGG